MRLSLPQQYLSENNFPILFASASEHVDSLVTVDWVEKYTRSLSSASKPPIVSTTACTASQEIRRVPNVLRSVNCLGNAAASSFIRSRVCDDVITHHQAALWRTISLQNVLLEINDNMLSVQFFNAVFNNYSSVCIVIHDIAYYPLYTALSIIFAELNFLK